MNTVTILSALTHRKNVKLNTLHGEVVFDENGEAQVSEEVAKALVEEEESTFYLKGKKAPTTTTTTTKPVNFTETTTTTTLSPEAILRQKSENFMIELNQETVPDLIKMGIEDGLDEKILKEKSKKKAELVVYLAEELLKEKPSVETTTTVEPETTTTTVQNN